MESVPFLSAEDVQQKLTSAECVSLMRETFRKEDLGECTQYLRTVIPMPNTNIMAAMPAFFNDGYFGMKILSVYPKNYLKNLPSHQGEIIVYDEKTGSVKGIVDAMSVTGIRTGACSAVATDLLARKDASVLALIGCGHQAWSHLAAIREVRDIKEVRVYDQIEEKAQAFARDAQEKYGVKIIACSSVQETVETADIVCTLTISSSPVLHTSWIREGTHINAVGACTPNARELPGILVQKARLFCDSIESVMNESGDFLFPLKEELITKDHLLGTIGQLLNEKIQGRVSNLDITIFESLGMAAEDLAAAAYVLDKE